MDRVPHSKRHNIQSDINSAWQAIDNGVVDQNNRKREKYWKLWCNYTQIFHKHPTLSDCTNSEQIIIITAFAARVRTGFYGRGRVVKVQTIKDTPAAISKTIKLAGEQSPIYKTDETYKLPVARLIEGYRRTDPPTVPQIALPVQAIETCLKQGYANDNKLNQAKGDLCIIAFFYMLRVGEYTKPRFIKKFGTHKRATRTVQFKLKNIGFFKNNKILPRNSKLQ